MLLDEPLNHLDMAHARALMTRLHALSRPGPTAKSVVLVLHDVNYAAAWADRVIAMKDGRVAVEGTPAEVLTAATFDQIYAIMRGRCTSTASSS
jgi:iron complex transport system ATP-binding protein